MSELHVIGYPFDEHSLDFLLDEEEDEYISNPVKWDNYLDDLFDAEAFRLLCIKEAVRATYKATEKFTVEVHPEIMPVSDILHHQRAYLEDGALQVARSSKTKKQQWIKIPYIQVSLEEYLYKLPVYMVQHSPFGVCQFAYAKTVGGSIAVPTAITLTPRHQWTTFSLFRELFVHEYVHAIRMLCSVDYLSEPAHGPQWKNIMKKYPDVRRPVRATHPLGSNSISMVLVGQTFNGAYFDEYTGSISIGKTITIPEKA